MSLILLFVGISLVQIQVTGSTNPSSSDQNPILGLGAVTVASLTSGFAGVYFEKILKSGSDNLWVRNVHMGTFGSILALFITCITDFAPIAEHGFWYGWNSIVWMVVIVQAVGGLVVAMVMKYADNILKNFASSISIILSVILSIFIFDFPLTFTFVAGTGIVCLAVYMYQLPEQEVKKVEK